jgi:hypothetical protein
LEYAGPKGTTKAKVATHDTKQLMTSRRDLEGTPLHKLRPSDLTASGWLLATITMGLGVLVEIPIALWARGAIDRGAFHAYPHVVSFLLGLPGILAAMLTFHFGRRALERVGIVVVRREGSTSNRQR